MPQTVDETLGDLLAKYHPKALGESSPGSRGRSILLLSNHIVSLVGTARERGGMTPAECVMACLGAVRMVQRQSSLTEAEALELFTASSVFLKVALERDDNASI